MTIRYQMSNLMALLSFHSTLMRRDWADCHLGGMKQSHGMAYICKNLIRTWKEAVPIMLCVYYQTVSRTRLCPRTRIRSFKHQQQLGIWSLFNTVIRHMINIYKAPLCYMSSFQTVSWIRLLRRKRIRSFKHLQQPPFNIMLYVV